ncbi:hypothetical protein K7432_012064 [Basidiobolus ranarum]|uniref:N-acetyltransferase domain-containing protein n=1 Tax=Basidiobolus ranarum TaxID=34480 RepID=A0ABR2WLC2_9FUNG
MAYNTQSTRDQTAQPQSELSTDHKRAAECLIQAFKSDPLMSRIIDSAKTEELRQELWCRYFEEMTKASIEEGKVYQVDDHKAVSIWFAPGQELTSFDKSQFSRHLGSEGMEKIRALGKMMHEMSDKLVGDKPMWYCYMVGVDPSEQGNGYASKVVRNITKLADEQQVICYLESSKPDNVPIYKHYGFHVVEVQHFDGDIPVYFMIRKPETQKSHL